MSSLIVNPFPLFMFQLLLAGITLVPASPEPMLFREYIGAEGQNVTFSDVPINPNVEFHFILSFAIDYNNSTSPPNSTNGDFKPYWDTQNLSPSHVSYIKSFFPNVKVALSIGGDTIAGYNVFFKPTSVSSWLRNAIQSITQLVQSNHLDGIDIDYEHFDPEADPDTFADCIGKLIYYLKQSKIVSFASIAPYDDEPVQSHYLALWRKYGHLIDYVDFQFYAYSNRTTIPEFMGHFKRQVKNYRGGKVLVSFGTDDSGGLKPEHGFFKACTELSRQGELHGIFIWSADDSKKFNFSYETQSQTLLTTTV